MFAHATVGFLCARPDAPVANIVAVPGGDGMLPLQPDGTIADVPARRMPVARTLDAFVAKGYSVALVDAVSNGTVYDWNDVFEVVRYMQARDDLPAWFIGGSA